MPKFKDTSIKPVLKAVVDKIDEVEESKRSLYAETEDGKFALLADIPLEEDFKRTYNTLSKVREEKKQAEEAVKTLKEEIAKYDGIDPIKYKGALADLEQLKSNNTNVVTLQSTNTELKYQLEQLSSSLQEKEKLIKNFESERKTNLLNDKARQALKKAGIASYAESDGLMWAKEQLQFTEDGDVRVRSGVSGIQEGLSVDTWAMSLKNIKPHLFGGTIGGGASGSTGATLSSVEWCDSKGNITNITKLSKAYREDPKSVLAIAKQKGIDGKIAKMFKGM